MLIKDGLYRLRRKKSARENAYPDTPDLTGIRLRDEYPFSGIVVDYLGTFRKIKL